MDFYQDDLSIAGNAAGSPITRWSDREAEGGGGGGERGNPAAINRSVSIESELIAMNSTSISCRVRLLIKHKPAARFINSSIDGAQ